MNKGEAVRMLCQMMGVDIADAVSVGDAANDLTMIEAAGIGVAMANATDEVKAIADYITSRDNNHDGIAEVVERFFGEQAE
jgi:hydroxymethylpyrimidine pyrophosphatase-like HAD family hydrolase